MHHPFLMLLVVGIFFTSTVHAETQDETTCVIEASNLLQRSNGTSAVDGGAKEMSKSVAVSKIVNSFKDVSMGAIILNSKFGFLDDRTMQMIKSDQKRGSDKEAYDALSEKLISQIVGAALVILDVNIANRKAKYSILCIWNTKSYFVRGYD